jgi:HEAT repeat protein
MILAGCGKSVKQKTAEDLNRFEIQYRSPDWTERIKAMISVSAYSSPQAVDILKKATEDSHSLVRIEALKGLDKIVSPSAKILIRNIAESENDDNVRVNAIRALAKYRDPTAALVFAKGLKSRDWLIREESIVGLLMIDDLTIKYISIPYIIEALGDRNESVVVTTLKNLDIRDPRIYKRIVKIMKSAPSYKHSIIIAALKALQGYRLDENTRKYLIEYLTHNNVDIRLLALRALKQESAQAEE